jgi:hypothetical protein
MGNGCVDEMKDKRALPIQNIPIRTELGKQIRDAFRAPIPDAILDVDYAGLERRTAELAGMDPDNLTECSDDGKCLYHALGGDVYDPCSDGSKS